MIVNALLNAIYKIFSVVFSAINIPPISADTIQAIDDLFTVIFDNTESIIGLFIPWTVINVLLPIIIVLEIALPVYHLVMWILRKIPFLGVS